MFEIKDNGRGIPKDKLRSIFDEQETDESADNWDGTGLGLPICLTICKSMDAFIRYMSLPDNFTIFRLYVPYVHLQTKVVKYLSAVSVSNTSEGRESEDFGHNCNQILLAEDNPNILKK